MVNPKDLTPERIANATVTRIDGQPIVCDADGLIHGEPLNLTDEERAALPPLGACDPNEPMVYAVGRVRES